MYSVVRHSRVRVIAHAPAMGASMGSGVRLLSLQSREEEAKEIWRNHASPCLAQISDIVVDEAKGAWVTDVNGVKYLDATCGIGATNTGHCHPKVVAAIQAQAAKGIHLQQNIMIPGHYTDLIKAIDGVTPKELSRYFFNGTGSEAVETAIKMARHYTGRQNIICMRGAFHGRTMAAMAMTSSKTAYHIGYGPFIPGVHSVPFPNCSRCKCHESPCCLEPLEDLKMLLRTGTDPSDTACIILEPVLGEGGYVTAPPTYMQGLRKLCDEHGIVLIIDEVQSGFGRTGKMFAFEHSGIVPDILVMAKGIASGMPISGIAARPELMSKSPKGSMGGTYGANALSAVAAMASIEVIKSEGLLDNAIERGQQLKEGLAKVTAAAKPDLLREVRGHGLMIGLEFNNEIVPQGFAGRVTAGCVAEKLLLMTTGPFEAMRFIPPLTITEEETDELVNRFERGLHRALAE